MEDICKWLEMINKLTNVHIVGWKFYLTNECLAISDLFFIIFGLFEQAIEFVHLINVKKSI